MSWYERLGWHRGEMLVNVGCASALLAAGIVVVVIVIFVSIALLR